MTRFSRLGAVALALLFAIPVASQTSAVVSQESAAGVGDFDANVVGTIQVFETTVTVAEFYNYHSNRFNGPDPAPPPPADPAPTHPADQAAFYLVKGSDGTALFAVYDRTTTGGQSNLVFRYTVSNGAFALPLVVQDDDPASSSDEFTFSAGNTVLDHTAQWPTGATDGFATKFTGSAPALVVDPVSFNSRVTGWNALSSDGNNLALAFSAGRRVKLALAEGNHQMPNEVVAGWRLLSAPVPGMTVDDLAQINLVQGVPAGTTHGPQYPAHGANLFHQYDGFSTGFLYTPVPHTDYAFEPGRGIWWYWYNLDLTPSDPTGTSVSRELTDANAALVYSGAPMTTDVQTTFAKPADDNGFYMGGNPFTLPFAVDGISSNVGNVQTVVSSWSPTLQSHVQYFFQNPANGNQPDHAAVWQGLLVEVTAAGGFPVPTDPTLTYAYASTSPTESPVFNGLTATKSTPTPHLHFRLDGTTQEGAFTSDHSSWIRFLPDASLGWDRHDGSKLLPGGETYALISPTDPRDRRNVKRLSVMSLPDGTTGPLPRRVDIPLSFLATDPGTYTLAWADGVLPPGWRAFLIDRQAGARIKMWRQSTYSFASGATDWEARFVVRLRPETADALDLDGDTALKSSEPSLGLPYPNPAIDAAHAVLDLDIQQHVIVRIVDVLGREVAVLRDEVMEPGAHTLVLPVGAMAPGTYRLQATGTTLRQTHELTVVR